jgi:hypothetical protein
MNADSSGIPALTPEISYAVPGLVTSNPRMLRIIDIARRVAQTDSPFSYLVSPVWGKTYWQVSFTGNPIARRVHS